MSPTPLDPAIVVLAVFVAVWCIGCVTAAFIFTTINRKANPMNLGQVKNFLSEAKKTVVTALGVVVVVAGPIVNEYGGFLPAKAVAAISGVVGLATILLNYFAPNETTTVARAYGRSVRVKGQKPATAVRPKPSRAA